MEASEIFTYAFGSVIIFICIGGPYMMAKELYPIELFLWKIRLSTLWKVIIEKTREPGVLIVKTGPVTCHYQKIDKADVLVFPAKENNETFSLAVAIDGSWEPKVTTKGMDEGSGLKNIRLEPKQARILDDYHSLIMPCVDMVQSII